MNSREHSEFEQSAKTLGMTVHDQAVDKARRSGAAMLCPRLVWGIEALVGKWTAGQRAYRLDRLADSKLRIAWSTTGSNALTASSTAAIPAGSVGVAVTLDVNNGSGGRAIKFWTTADGVTWTQLGSTVTQSGVTWVYGGNQPLFVGRSSSGSSESFVGTLDSVEVWQGIRNLTAGTGGSLRANPRFSDAGEWTGSTLGVDQTATRWTLQGTATVDRPGIGSGAQTTTYTYDIAGRMLSTTDPDRGTTTYGYDGAGRVIRRTDARGIAVHYIRDAQGRVVEERLGSTSGTMVASYTYATSGPSKGLLTGTASFEHRLGGRHPQQRSGPMLRLRPITTAHHRIHHRTRNLCHTRHRGWVLVGTTPHGCWMRPDGSGPAPTAPTPFGPLCSATTRRGSGASLRRRSCLSVAR